MLVRMWRKRTTFALLVGMQAGATLWKTEWSLIRKIKIELIYDPEIALLGICSKDTDVVKLQDTCLPCLFYFILFIFFYFSLPAALGFIKWS